MPSPGRVLLDHLKTEIPDLDDATIATWAGVTRQRVTDWARSRSQGGPQHAEVIRLARAAHERYPSRDVGPYRLLQVAGFEHIPAPWGERRNKLLKRWGELTLRIQDADIVTLGRAVRAAEEALENSRE